MTSLNKPIKLENKIDQQAHNFKKNARWLLIGGIATITITVGILIIRYYKDKQEVLAQADMVQAVYFFEQDSLEKALYGDGVYMGFLTLIDEYPTIPATNLAHFYVGTIYMHQQKYNEAIAHLMQFKAKDMLIQARAYALLGDAWSEQKVYDKAVFFYKKAASYHPNSIFTPMYLTKAAITYEANKQYTQAITCYQQIIDQYPKSSHVNMATKHISRINTYLHNLTPAIHATQ